MAIIPASVKQFDYLMQSGMSIRGIARATGIPYSTLQASVRFGTRIAPAHRATLRAAYGRATYASLRDQGWSAPAARASQFARSEVVGMRQATFSRIVDDLTIGQVEAMQRRADIAGEPLDREAAWIKARSGIVKGMSKSRKTFKDWERYISPDAEEEVEE